MRRPQSYLREAVWRGGAEPRIWTRHPRFNGLEWAGTPWSFPDLRATWTFPDVAPGTPVRCFVYTDADEIVFEIWDDRALGYYPKTPRATANYNGRALSMTNFLTFQGTYTAAQYRNAYCAIKP